MIGFLQLLGVAFTGMLAVLYVSAAFTIAAIDRPKTSRVWATALVASGFLTFTVAQINWYGWIA